MHNHSLSQPSSLHRNTAWIVTMTASLFFFYEFIQMNLFNAINLELREAFKLDAIQLGRLFSMYFYANFICLFPAGNLLDRFSTKLLLLLAAIICTFGTFLFSIAHTYFLAATGRFLVGIGASFCFLSCIKLASRWFRPKEMAFVTGAVVTMAMLGGLIAQTPFTLLTYALGNWRHALLINTGLGLFIILAIFLWVQDYPPHTQIENKSEKEQLKKLGLWQCIKLAALNPQNWLGGLYTSLLNLPVFILGGLWGMLYLTNVHHLSNAQASYATTIFFVGVIFGSLAFGWISDYIERRILPMTAGAILSLLVIAILMYVPHLSIASLIFLFFLMGFVTSSQVLTYPTIAELNPIYLTSTAVSIDSLCIMASGFIVPPLFGWLMEKNSLHTMVNGITQYTADDFNHAMLIIPVAFIVGLFITFFMRETYCKSQV